MPLAALKLWRSGSAQPPFIPYSAKPGLIRFVYFVLSLKSKIIHVKRLAPGATSGYGRKFSAKDPTTIGILPIGYAQGYSFAAWEKAQVLYRGKRFHLAGRISMDYMTVNFGDQHIRAGDTVTLLGEDGNDCITANEIANWAGTIPYEIVTALQHYLPRVIT